MDEKKILWSPFLWGISENAVLKYDEKQESEHNDSSVVDPVISLIENLVLVFVYTVKKKLDVASEKMKIATDTFKCLKDVVVILQKSIDPIVLRYIFITTKYYYEKYYNQSKVSLIGIPEIVEYCKTTMNYSTLKGCKSIAYSMFHEKELDKAIEYAQDTIKMNPNCAIWHFILAKNLRRCRRYRDFNFKPIDEETNHFIKAYELSNGRNPYFSIFTAQMFREKGDKTKALEIYVKLYKSQPKELNLILRLALAFIRLKEFYLANECLKKASEINPKNSMYLHYKGILHESQKEFKKASEFFYEAAKLGNLTAELQYAHVMIKASSRFDCIKYFKAVIEKYQDRIELVQQLTTHIAMQYFYKKNNVKFALVYFAKAIQIDPTSNQLKNFCNSTINFQYFNVIKFVHDTILYEFDRKYKFIPEDCKNAYAYLKNITQDVDLSNFMVRMRLNDS